MCKAIHRSHYHCCFWSIGVDRLDAVAEVANNHQCCADVGMTGKSVDVFETAASVDGVVDGFDAGGVG